MSNEQIEVLLRDDLITKTKYMSGIFLDDWDDVNDLIESFHIEPKRLDGLQVLVASYSHYDYTGSAYVLLRREEDGQLFEIHGSHCSCFGLEEQFDPEETDIASIRYRITNGTWGEGRSVKDAILKVLDIVEKRLM